MYLINFSFEERCYSRIKNWTKGLDLFSKDFIIIPINKNYHWFLAIICYPNFVENHTSESYTEIDMDLESSTNVETIILNDTIRR